MNNDYRINIQCSMKMSLSKVYSRIYYSYERWEYYPKYWINFQWNCLIICTMCCVYYAWTLLSQKKAFHFKFHLIMGRNIMRFCFLFFFISYHFSSIIYQNMKVDWKFSHFIFLNLTHFFFLIGKKAILLIEKN